MFCNSRSRNDGTQTPKPTGGEIIFQLLLTSRIRTLAPFMSFPTTTESGPVDGVLRKRIVARDDTGRTLSGHITTVDPHPHSAGNIHLGPTVA